MRANGGGSWAPAARPAARSWGSPGWARRPRQSPRDRPRDRLPGTGHSFQAGTRCQGRMPGGSVHRDGPALAHSPGSRDPTGPGEGRQGGLGAGGQNLRSANCPRAQDGAPSRQSHPPTSSGRTLVQAPLRPIATKPAQTQQPWGGGHSTAMLGARATSSPPCAPGVPGSSPVLETPVTATSSPPLQAGGSAGPLQPVCSFWEQGPPEGLAVRQQRVTASCKLLCQAL